MKQITITVPDNCELKKDDNTYTIIEKEKKLTYDDVAKKLLSGGDIYFTSANGNIVKGSYESILGISDANNVKSKKQLEKLLAINKLMNVAKYLNGDWQPDWKDTNGKFFIAPNHETNRFDIEEDIMYQNSYIYFKSEEVAKQAIEILEEETIKLALCTDY